MALVTAETAADLVRSYDFGRHRRLLDVGGGYGTFARAVLSAYGSLRVTLVDLPDVAATVAGQAVPGLTAVGADVFETPLPDGHDGWLAETGWSRTGLITLPVPSSVIQAGPV